LSVTGGVEKPRWITLGFQTNKYGNQEKHPAAFYHLDLKNAYVTLYSERFPIKDLNTNLAKHDYMKLYDIFDAFKQDYYGISSLAGGTQKKCTFF